MIAFVTTIGEKATDLCIWSLKRNGFEVHTISGDDSLADKLERIYEEAHNLDIDFLRVDADIVVNKYCTPERIKTIARMDIYKDAWWLQFQTYDWYQQMIGYGGVQYIKREAVPILKNNLKYFKGHERPETELSRSHGMYNPRRFESFDALMGLNNYKNDMKRVAKVKANRGQSDNYDFELAQRLEEL